MNKKLNQYFRSSMLGIGLLAAMVRGVKSWAITIPRTLWFHFCVKMENIDPLQGGYLRRKYRKDRRPTMPVESPFVFYPRYVGNLIYKHVKLGQLMWRFHWFCKRLERDPAAREYTDAALRVDFEHDGESMEMLAGHAEHKTVAV